MNVSVKCNGGYELDIKPNIKNWPLPKDRKVAALRQRNRRGNLQSWVKVDKQGNSKATQNRPFLSDNILSGTVKTRQWRIQVDFEPAFRDQKSTFIRDCRLYSRYCISQK